jgi:hypothetical protein
MFVDLSREVFIAESIRKMIECKARLRRRLSDALGRPTALLIRTT